MSAVDKATKMYEKILKLQKKKSLSEKELKEIYKFLKLCSDLYYSPEEGEDTILTDEEFDNLVKLYEEKSGKRYKLGSSKVAGNKKLVNIEHQFPDLVGTLFKTYSIAEVEQWLNIKLGHLADSDINGQTISFVVSLKYDGNSAVGIYDNRGKCKNALTRGEDGKGMSLFNIFEGNEVGFHSTNKTDKLGIKYEVITTTSDFNKICELKGKSYANMRSVVAGILSGDGGEQYADYLTFVPIKIESASDDRKTQTIKRKDQLKLLNEMMVSNKSIPFTFKTFTYRDVCDKDELIELFINDLNKFYTTWTDKRNELSYMIDGIVIEILNEDIRKKLGRTGFENNFECALKFPYMTKSSKIIGMRFDTGKTNRITPVAIFEPVYFNGAKCEHVSLSNYKRFKELNLAIGDRVSIEYHGDVLSYLNKIPGGESGEKPIKFISHCPDCKEKLKVTKNDKGEKVFVYCPNKKCPSGKKGKILNYVKKMDIKGIDESTINDLFNNGLVKTIAGLYTLSEKSILDIEGYQEKSAANIVSAIQSRKDVYDYEMLGSLLITNFGRDSAKLLLTKMDYSTIMYEIENENYDFLKSNIKKLDGFADKSAEYIVNGIRKNYKLIKRLEEYLNIKHIKDEIAKKQQEMNIDPNAPKYKVVVTGDLEWGDRSAFKEMIENMGHKMVGSISSKVDILITNDPTSGTVKNKKAKELGIPVLTEKEAFIKLGIK